MAGEYWKAIESYQRELAIREENERKKALEERQRVEEEVRQRNEVEERERQKILTQARSILLSMFREIQANAPELKQAPKYRIIEESDQYKAPDMQHVKTIRLQYGEKFGLTDEEQTFIKRYPDSKDGYIDDSVVVMERNLIFFKKNRIKHTRKQLSLPKEMIEFEFNEVGFYYDDKHLLNTYFKTLSKTIDFIQNPTIIIPNILYQLKSPKKQIRILKSGIHYLREPPPSRDYNFVFTGDCCCS